MEYTIIIGKNEKMSYREINVNTFEWVINVSNLDNNESSFLCIILDTSW